MALSLLYSVEKTSFADGPTWLITRNQNFGGKIETTARALVGLFFSGLCCGKAMVAYTKPQQRKKEESEQLRG